jgi:hypothetical protein
VRDVSRCLSHRVSHRLLTISSTVPSQHGSTHCTKGRTTLVFLDRSISAQNVHNSNAPVALAELSHKLTWLILLFVTTTTLSPLSPLTVFEQRTAFSQSEPCALTKAVPATFLSHILTAGVVLTMKPLSTLYGGGAPWLGSLLGALYPKAEMQSPPRKRGECGGGRRSIHARKPLINERFEQGLKTVPLCTCTIQRIHSPGRHRRPICP